MISIFSATNRKNSRSRQVADFVYQSFENHSAGEELKFFSLEDLPLDILTTDMYAEAGQSEALAAIQDEFFIPAQKLYFVMPEYNGSYPGVLKLFMDAISIRRYKESFHGGKKAALLGVAAGRAGNLRGMEHFTGVLNYLQINVMPNRLPISTIDKLIDETGKIHDEATRTTIEGHVKNFIAF